VALVDDADYEELAKHKWFCDSRGYVARKVPHPLKRQVTELMHRVILGLEYGDPRQGDHRNRNRLDNQRSNLRLASNGENQRNKGDYATNTSGVRGVYWYKPTQRWKAQINVDGKKKHLGYFQSIDDASEAYKQAVRQLHGEFGAV
jgi:hypothetical protein